eukprot:6392387-Amphidinium_carterae.1
MALGLQLSDERITVPQNVFQLDYIRPDFAMLRLVSRCCCHRAETLILTALANTICRCLIMWESIEVSED